ncbi:MAG: hypothetical protein H6839_13685 [Planctomycetes bacterium]|nr:hypothetical protein [Planctomycetota bacterium]
MAEPDKGRDLPSPEVQLFARMRLQRVVFGSFAIVLVCLFALGLSAYRKMQRETADALAAAQDAELRASQARAQADRLERRLQEVHADLLSAEHQLALAKCRLAMHEIRDGHLARARGLLDEARLLGAPAWSPLIEKLTQNATVRFEGGLADSPILAGAVSGDRATVGVARETADGAVVELYGALDGKLRFAYPPVKADRAPDSTCRLLLSRDGASWFLQLGDRTFFGDGGVSSAASRVGDDTQPSGIPVLAIAGASDLSQVYAATGAGGLILFRHGPGAAWSRRRIELDLQSQQVDAVCIADGKPVVATPRGIYHVGEDGRTGLLYALGDAPDRVALHYGAGAVYAAMLTGRSLALAAIKPGDEPNIITARHDLPDEPAEDLCFLADDTPVWVGRSGRLITLSFSDKKEWMLGGYTLSFIGRHPQGLVFGNRKGELSVRVQEEFRTVGMPLMMLPPQYVAEPQAFGFVLHAPDSDCFAVLDGQVRALGNVADAAIAPKGAAFSSDVLTLPGGLISREQGKLLGAFSDGSVLLFAHGQKLKHVGSGGVSEFLLPGERAPDATVLSSAGLVAAVRVADTVYVSDMASDLQQLASRVDVAPDLLALDAAGAHLAIAYGPTVVVHGLGDESSETVRTIASPKEICLLFEGSVLVSLEAGELVFYEVASGRELLRTGGSVTDVAASGDASLNLIAGGWLHTLSLVVKN